MEGRIIIGFKSSNVQGDDLGFVTSLLRLAKYSVWSSGDCSENSLIYELLMERNVCILTSL